MKSGGWQFYKGFFYEMCEGEGSTISKDKSLVLPLMK